MEQIILDSNELISKAWNMLIVSVIIFILILLYALFKWSKLVKISKIFMFIAIVGMTMNIANFWGNIKRGETYLKVVEQLEKQAGDTNMENFRIDFDEGLTPVNTQKENQQYY